MMCDPSLIIGGIGVAGAVMNGVNTYSQSQASAKSAEYQAGINAQNAQIAKQNAVNERQAGINNARKIQIQTAQNIASQKTAMAANGVDVTAGNALDLVDTTKYFGEMDAFTTKQNAEYKAQAYESEANNFLEQAGLSSMVADNYRKSSLLSGLGTTMTGLGQVNSSWYGFNKTKTNLPAKSGTGKLS